jgi:peroxiredoxin
VTAVIGIGLWSSRSSGPGSVPVGKKAPAFKLASSTGGTVSLSDYAGKNLLLYFNEGVGCDACFYQSVELEKRQAAFDEAGVSIAAIVVNPLDEVRPVLDRLDIGTPYLIDEGADVSKAYGMLGKGMHANLPGHGFVLIDDTGRIRWEKEYPSMWASAGEILAQIRPYLG